jgi:hypothetical protein
MQLHAMLISHPSSRAVMEAHPDLKDLQLLRRALAQVAPREGPTRVVIEEDSEESEEEEEGEDQHGGGSDNRMQPQQPQSAPAPPTRLPQTRLPPTYLPPTRLPPKQVAKQVSKKTKKKKKKKKKKKRRVPLSDCADRQLRLCVQWLRRQLVSGELGYQLLWQHTLNAYEWMLVTCANTVSWHNAFKHRVLRWEDVASEEAGVGKKWGVWDDFVGRVGEHGLPVAAQGLRLRKVGILFSV